MYADADVKEEINRKVEPHVPLPDLVNTAYTIRGNEWDETRKRWEQESAPTPPVMITVANLTHTAARVEYALSHKKIPIEKLSDSDRILHIDSKALGEAEAKEEAPEIESATGGVENSEAEAETPLKKLTKQEPAAPPRKTVDPADPPPPPRQLIHPPLS